MSVLIIDEAVEDRINAAVERARAKTIPWSTLRGSVVTDDTNHLAYGDREPVIPGKSGVSEFVLIPHGFVAAISFEEQPAGICRHLSISLDGGQGKLPNAPAIDLIAEAFGFKLPLKGHPGRIWIEEFEPGEYAVNIVQIATDVHEAGNA